MHLVYDGSNRESFEAVPQWLEELENYVPPEVVKIVVENKLDKVMSSPPLSSPSSFPPTADALHLLTPPPSRNTFDKCPHRKAQCSQRGREIHH
jgi:Ras family